MTATTGPDKSARNWGMLCHLSALTGFIIPFGNIIGPFIIWLLKKEEYPFVNEQGKEAINFQITVIIAFMISALLIYIVIGFLLMFAVAVYNLVMIIIAAIKASEGQAYHYPYSLRLIK